MRLLAQLVSADSLQRIAIIRAAVEPLCHLTLYMLAFVPLCAFGALDEFTTNPLTTLGALNALPIHALRSFSPLNALTLDPLFRALQLLPLHSLRTFRTLKLLAFGTLRSIRTLETLAFHSLRTLGALEILPLGTLRTLGTLSALNTLRPLSLLFATLAGLSKIVAVFSAALGVRRAGQRQRRNTGNQ